MDGNELNLNNEMFGEVDIIGTRTNLIQGSLTVRIDSSNKIDGLLDIPLFSKDNLLHGEITVKRESIASFNGSIMIDVTNFMFGEVDIYDTPENRQYGILVKDSYTLSTHPNINYGQDSILYFSNDSTVFLEYSFSANQFELFYPENELDAHLSIYLNRALQQPAQGEVYLTSTHWFEDAITDSNKPDVEHVLSFDVPLNYIGWIDIPIGNLLKDYNKLSSFNFALAVKINTSSFTRSPSREGSYELSPKLYYKYNYIPPTLRVRKIYGEIVVRKDSTDKFNGYLEVDSSYNEEKLDGIISVPKYNGLRSFSGSMFVIQRPIESKLEGVLNIPLLEQTSLFNGTIRVSKTNEDYLYGSLSIPLFSNERLFNGTLTVQKEEISLLNGDLSIPLFEDVSTLQGSITIEKEEINYLQGQVIIPIFDELQSFSGYITVEQVSTIKISGLLDVPLFENVSILQGTIIVEKQSVNFLQGQVIIPLFDELDSFNGNLTVGQVSTIKINGLLDVPLFENQSQFDGTLDVQEMWNSLFDGMIDIPLFQQSASFDGSLSVMPVNISMLKGIIRVSSGRRSRAYVYIM
ncbi:CBM96 family carbohydrate-binding protein [Halalkalibacter oceani]|uniref:CBM96 family carbohydrate-binding protein n=1 Tax=Halalkalibacter oceani TaxID=1653776 RepID=UPI0035F4A40F